MTNPLELLTAIPPKVRSALYLALVVAGVVLGAIQIWFTTNGGVSPDWLFRSLNVLAYVGAALGLTAKKNVVSRQSGRHVKE